MKFRNLLLLIAAASSFSVASHDGNILKTDVEGYMSRGVAMYNEQNYVGAIDQLQQVRKFPNSENFAEYADLLIALSKYNLGDSKALDYLNVFLDKYRTTRYAGDAIFAMGNHYFYNGKYGEAMVIYSMIPDGILDSDSKADMYYRAAYSKMRLGDFDLAKADIGKISNIKRYRDAAKFYTGYIHYVKGEYGEALKCFSSVSGNEELSYNARYYIAQIRFTQGDYDKTVQMGRSLLSGNRQNIEFRHELLRIVGESYYHLQESGKSADYLEQYFKECDNRNLSPMRSAKYTLGVIRFNEARHDEAIACMQQATNADDAMAQSAYLYIGQSYVAKGNYNSASMAFEKAMKMNFDPETRETAFFNYAVAQSGGSRNPFSRTIDIFEDFINNYPESKYAGEVGEYLCNAYISGNDYARAYESISHIKMPSREILQAEQYVLYNLAASNFSNGKVSDAASQLSEAVTLGDFGNGIMKQCYLLLGDCRYKQEKYKSAANDYRKYLSGTVATDVNYALGWYNLGYAQFKQKLYSDARTSFTRAINATLSQPSLVADAQTRIGDTYYYGHDFSSAETYYSKARATSPATSDYALFQQAIMNGLQKKHSQKISLIDKFLADFPNSAFAPNAMLEKAQAQISLGNNDAAAGTFQRLLAKYPASAEARKGLLQLAITYKNIGNEQRALSTYKKVVTQYPSSEEASLAVEDMKVIYSENGNIDALQTFLGSVPNAPKIDVSEVDKLTFYAAEKAFMGEKNDISKIKEYLKRFPSGAYALQARFYEAKSMYSNGEYPQALAQLNDVLNDGSDASFAEDALAMKADILMRQGHATDAMNTYKELLSKATTSDNRLAAQLGMLRAASDLGRYNEVITAANSLLSGGVANADEEQEARFYRANAYRNIDKGEDAVNDWKKLAKDPRSVYGAKSAYYLAEYYFNAGNSKVAEKTLNEFIDEGTPHQYWLARAFILLSDVYAKKGDNFEAREYLESLKSNYPGKEADIFQMIEQRLSKLPK